jgi:RNA polymerase primary sigma factor
VASKQDGWTTVDQQDERHLVVALMAGDKVAAARFLDLAASAIWSTVAELIGENAAGEEAFLTVIAALKADGFARLAAFDGRSRLVTYLVLVAREVLGEQLARALATDPNSNWRRFDRFCGGDIRRAIARRFPQADEAARKDKFQKVCLQLIENDYHRIRAFGGHGNFSGYVNSIVDRLLIDMLRAEVSRLRLPAEIERLPRLHQALFIAGAWGGVPLDAQHMASAIAGKVEPAPQPDEIFAALRQVAGAIAAARGSPARIKEVSLDADGQEGLLDLAERSASVEELLIEQEERSRRDALVEAVTRESATLPALDRSYVQLMLGATGSLPARDIARRLALPVEQVYRLKQRVDRWLKKILAELRETDDRSVWSPKES